MKVLVSSRRGHRGQKQTANVAVRPWSAPGSLFLRLSLPLSSLQSRTPSLPAHSRSSVLSRRALNEKKYFYGGPTVISRDVDVGAPFLVFKVFFSLARLLLILKRPGNLIEDDPFVTLIGLGIKTERTSEIWRCAPEL